MADSKSSVTLYVYDIENSLLTRAYSSLKENFEKKLSMDKGSGSNNRRRILNTNVHEEDFLASYAILDCFIFGSIWRIAPQKEMPNISTELFKNDTISFAQIADSKNESGLACKACYYFAISKDSLITNLSNSNIRP